MTNDVNLVFTKRRQPPPLVAESWPSFLECVRKARADLGEPATPWYRGMPNSKYELIPSLLRHPKGLASEQHIFNEYQRSAARLTSPRHNDWELLFDMQHYGIPTRLLDWTEVLGIAVAFALFDEADDGQDSSIHVLDPIKLNLQSGIQGIKRPTTDPSYVYKSIYWHNQPFSPIRPIAIDAPLQNDRMVAQQACFTIHGTEGQYFESNSEDFLRKIIIRPSAKQGAREFLEYANLSPISIYPDIVGMVRHIVKKHLA